MSESWVRIAALSAGVILLGLIYASTIFPYLAGAVGMDADAQCVPLKPECSCGLFKDEKGKCTKPGNKFMCPCFDVTSGHVTSGTCQANFKCKGESTGGMPPMLPMIMPPMMMPMMMMPQDPCMQPGGGGTSEIKNDSSSTSTGAASSTPPCPDGGFGGSGFGSDIFDTSGYFNNSSDDISGSLFDDLNQPKGGVSNFLVNSSSSAEGGEEESASPIVPTTTSKLRGVIRVGNAGATILANLREGMSEVAGFFGGNALGAQASLSVVGRLCAARPWAKGLITSIVPSAFFDTLCRRAGYQVGVVTPQSVSGSAAKKMPPQAQKKQPPANLGPVEVNIWAEPASVRLGTRTYIFWNSKGVLDCKVSGPNFSHNTLSGGASTVPLSGATTYSIVCTAPDGTTAEDRVTVNLAI